MRLIAILVLASAFFARADKTIVGRWEGSAQIPGRPVRFVIDLEQETRGGTWSGSISSPDLGLKGAALSNIATHAADVTFAIKTALSDQRIGPAKFNGHLSDDGKLTGD